jgi:hypothetical protein
MFSKPDKTSSGLLIVGLHYKFSDLPGVQKYGQRSENHDHFEQHSQLDGNYTFNPKGVCNK